MTADEARSLLRYGAQRTSSPLSSPAALSPTHAAGGRVLAGEAEVPPSKLKPQDARPMVARDARPDYSSGDGLGRDARSVKRREPAHVNGHYVNGLFSGQKRQPHQGPNGFRGVMGRIDTVDRRGSTLKRRRDFPEPEKGAGGLGVKKVGLNGKVRLKQAGKDGRLQERNKPGHKAGTSPGSAAAASGGSGGALGSQPPIRNSRKLQELVPANMTERQQLAFLLRQSRDEARRKRLRVASSEPRRRSESNGSDYSDSESGDDELDDEDGEDGVNGDVSGSGSDTESGGRRDRGASSSEEVRGSLDERKAPGAGSAVKVADNERAPASSDGGRSPFPAPSNGRIRRKRTSPVSSSTPLANGRAKKSNSQEVNGARKSPSSGRSDSVDGARGRSCDSLAEDASVRVRVTNGDAKDTADAAPAADDRRPATPQDRQVDDDDDDGGETIGASLAKPEGYTDWSPRKKRAWDDLGGDPNAFYEDYVPPGVTMAKGDWTEAERLQFVKVLQEHPAGEKWGLFSMHMPARTGRQCREFFQELVNDGVLDVLDCFPPAERAARIKEGENDGVAEELDGLRKEISEEHTPAGPADEGLANGASVQAAATTEKKEPKVAPARSTSAVGGVGRGVKRDELGDEARSADPTERTVTKPATSTPVAASPQVVIAPLSASDAGAASSVSAVGVVACSIADGIECSPLSPGPLQDFAAVGENLQVASPPASVVSSRQPAARDAAQEADASSRPSLAVVGGAEGAGLANPSAAAIEQAGRADTPADAASRPQLIGSPGPLAEATAIRSAPLGLDRATSVTASLATSQAHACSPSATGAALDSPGVTSTRQTSFPVAGLGWAGASEARAAVGEVVEAGPAATAATVYSAAATKAGGLASPSGRADAAVPQAEPAADFKAVREEELQAKQPEETKQRDAADPSAMAVAPVGNATVAGSEGSRGELVDAEASSSGRMLKERATKVEPNKNGWMPSCAADVSRELSNSSPSAVGVADSEQAVAAADAAKANATAEAFAAGEAAMAGAEAKPSPYSISLVCEESLEADFGKAPLAREEVERQARAAALVGQGMLASDLLPSSILLEQEAAVAVSVKCLEDVVISVRTVKQERDSDSPSGPPLDGKAPASPHGAGGGRTSSASDTTSSDAETSGLAGHERLPMKRGGSEVFELVELARWGDGKRGRTGKRQRKSVIAFSPPVYEAPPARPFLEEGKPVAVSLSFDSSVGAALAEAARNVSATPGWEVNERQGTSSSDLAKPKGPLQRLVRAPSVPSAAGSPLPGTPSFAERDGEESVLHEQGVVDSANTEEKPASASRDGPAAGAPPSVDKPEKEKTKKQGSIPRLTGMHRELQALNVARSSDSQGGSPGSRRMGTQRRRLAVVPMEKRAPSEPSEPRPLLAACARLAAADAAYFGASTRARAQQQEQRPSPPLDTLLIGGAVPPDFSHFAWYPSGVPSAAVAHPGALSAPKKAFAYSAALAAAKPGPTTPDVAFTMLLEERQRVAAQVALEHQRLDRCFKDHLERVQRRCGFGKDDSDCEDSEGINDSLLFDGGCEQLSKSVLIAQGDGGWRTAAEGPLFGSVNPKPINRRSLLNKYERLKNELVKRQKLHLSALEARHGWLAASGPLADAARRAIKMVPLSCEYPYAFKEAIPPVTSPTGVSTPVREAGATGTTGAPAPCVDDTDGAVPVKVEEKRHQPESPTQQSR